MDWIKSNIAINDNINMRNEIRGILHGDEKHVKLGYWIIYRRFDRTKKTESYSERTHESIGAPGYVYTDTLIRTRRVPISKEGDMLNPLKPGINIGDRYVYYFEFCVNPKIGDQIFELNLTNHKCKPIITPALYKERFTIERVHDYRLENGNVQYYIVNCGYDEMSY